MTTRLYSYVGPEHLRQGAHQAVGGQSVSSKEDLAKTLLSIAPDLRRDKDDAVFTFVVDQGGSLRLADRHFEHVLCAQGEAVLTAGELTVCKTAAGYEVTAATNQSTGYCPEPESWAALEQALDCLGLKHPSGWTASFLFRRCPSCRGICIIKDGWFICDVCGADLPEHYNV